MGLRKYYWLRTGSGNFAGIQALKETESFCTEAQLKNAGTKGSWRKRLVYLSHFARGQSRDGYVLNYIVCRNPKKKAEYQNIKGHTNKRARNYQTTHQAQNPSGDIYERAFEAFIGVVQQGRDAVVQQVFPTVETLNQIAGVMAPPPAFVWNNRPGNPEENIAVVNGNGRVRLDNNF